MIEKYYKKLIEQTIYPPKLSNQLPEDVRGLLRTTQIPEWSDGK